MGERQERVLTHREVLLEIEGLEITTSIERKEFPAVCGLSLRVYRGEVVALLGETGSGVSLVAQAILRLLPRTARIVKGAVRFHRNVGDTKQVVDLAALPEKSRELHDIRGKEISLLLREAESGLAPTHSAMNQVLEVMRLPRGTSKQEARQKVSDIFRLVGITEPERYLDAPPVRLTASLRQRVLIAIAVAAYPTLLVADGPTHGMDVIMEGQVLTLLERLQEELNLAVLLATDDPSVAAALADRVAVMYLGRLVELAPKRELLVDPMHPYTRGLLQSAMNLGLETPQHLPPLAGTTPGLITLVSGCPFHPRCPSFMAHKCEEAVPELVEATPGHWVACYLYSGLPETP